MFHDFFAAEFAAGEVIEDLFAVLGEESFALGDALGVGFFELEPPVRFQSRQCCICIARVSARMFPSSIHYFGGRARQENR